MSFLRRVICFALPLLFLVSAPAQAEETAFGYAWIGRLYRAGWNGAQFDVMTPFYPLENVYIKLSLSLRAKDGQRPENVVCSLRRNFRHVPADRHAVSAGNGGLGLSFDQLESFTHLRFVIAWEDKPEQRAALTGAAIHAADTVTDWKRSAELSGRSAGVLAKTTPSPSGSSSPARKIAG